MKNYLTYLSLIVLYATAINAEEIFHKKGVFDLRLTGFYSISSSYFDSDGEEIVNLYERFSETDTNYYKYTYDNTSYVIGLYGEYSFTDGFSVYAAVPLGFYSLSEKWQMNESGTKKEKANYSLTQPAYYNFGSKFSFLSGEFYSFGILDFKIPPGFHKGILDDPEYPFLSDGAFELTPSIFVGYSFPESWFEIGASYNFRDEELADTWFFHGEAGLKSVEKTSLRLMLDYAHPTDKIAGDSTFDLEQTQLHEEYLRIGGALRILFDNNVYAELSYKVRLFGKDAWAGGYVTVDIGTYF